MKVKIHWELTIVSSSFRKKGLRRSGKVPLRNDIKTEICKLTMCFARFRKGREKSPTGDGICTKVPKSGRNLCM